MKFSKYELGSLFLALSLFSTDAYAEKVCISMPTTANPKWVNDGNLIKESLEKSGHSVVLEFANGSAKTQKKQIDQMVKDKCNFLVITAVDSKSLSGELIRAKRAGVFTFAYERLILNTKNLSGYISFKTSNIGRKQGQYIVDRLLVDKSSKVKHIEIFTGPLEDNNVNYLYAGAMLKLNPYIADGTFVVKSGQIEKNVVATEYWSASLAEKRMRDLIRTQGYGPNGVKLDAVLAPNDGIALGIIKALKGVGYTADTMPVITGQDSSVDGIKALLAGDLSMTIFKDSRVLVKALVDNINAIVKKEPLIFNDRYSFYNGKMTVPAFLGIAQTVDILNYKDLLFKSGFYNENDFKANSDIDKIKAQLEIDKAKADLLKKEKEEAEQQAKAQHEAEKAAKEKAKRDQLVGDAIAKTGAVADTHDENPILNQSTDKKDKADYDDTDYLLNAPTEDYKAPAKEIEKTPDVAPVEEDKALDNKATTSSTPDYDDLENLLHAQYASPVDSTETEDANSEENNANQDAQNPNEQTNEEDDE